MRSICLSIIALLVLAIPAGGAAQGGDSLCVVSEEELEATATATVEVVANPLEGNLGGSFEAFEALYYEDGTFQQEGCSEFSTISGQPSVDGTAEIVTVIDLWTARDEDIEAGTLDDPSEANWTGEEATTIAHELLPPDTVFDGEFQTTEAGNLVRTGYSEALAAVTVPEHYSYHGSTESPGAVEVVLFLSADSTVWNVVVQLGGIN